MHGAIGERVKIVHRLSQHRDREWLTHEMAGVINCKNIPPMHGIAWFEIDRVNLHNSAIKSADCSKKHDNFNDNIINDRHLS